MKTYYTCDLADDFLDMHPDMHDKLENAKKEAEEMAEVNGDQTWKLYKVTVEEVPS